MFLTICSWMAFCLCYTTFETFLRPLYYFGEVSFKNLILSDICGVGYGSQTQRLTLHGSFDRSRLELSRTLSPMFLVSIPSAILLHKTILS
ncbi:hypothetical protein B0192_11950 [Leptospira interrogans serovar Australis]|nr:hypothetical protein B0192_11950 [Leptospira interrogans serovar Australis]